MIYLSESINDNTSLRVTPNWFGSFYTTSECDTNKCCCIYGLLILSKAKPNYLRIQGHLQGLNCPDNPEIDSRITIPTGFKIEIILMGGPVVITLSEDSRTLRLYNQHFPACNGGAIRNHAKSIRSIHPILMMISIFIVKKPNKLFSLIYYLFGVMKIFALNIRKKKKKKKFLYNKQDNLM